MSSGLPKALHAVENWQHRVRFWWLHVNVSKNWVWRS